MESRSSQAAVLPSHTVTVEHWEHLKVQFQQRTLSRLSRTHRAAESHGTLGPKPPEE